MSAEMVAAVPAPHEMTVSIGPMRRRHLRAVLRIENQVYPRPWTMGLYLGEINQKQGRCYLVAKVNGAVVGYGGMLLAVGDAHITTIAVDPRYQRHKIGSRLLLALARSAIDHEATNLTLEVRVGNKPAQELYRRFGFAPAGVRKGYYTETNEDAIVMWAHDIDLAVHRQRLDAVAAAVNGTTTWEGVPR